MRVPAGNMLKVLMLAAAVYHSQLRQRQLAAQLAIVKKRMDTRACNAKAIMANFAAMAGERRKERREVPRCLGKWRGFIHHLWLPPWRASRQGRDHLS